MGFNYSTGARITSTYVEKTFSRPKHTDKFQDHLHIRGENAILGQMLFGVSGSPPHTWRKPSVFATDKRNPRITSTYVEKTFMVSLVLVRQQDHLHIRGENYKLLQRHQLLLGSPPHTWRKLSSPITNSF